MFSLINILDSSFCDSIAGQKILMFIGYILSFSSIIIPIIVIIYGTIDLLKAIFANNNDSNKNLLLFLRRIIYSCCIFFVYPLVMMIIGMVTNDNYSENACIYCLKNSSNCNEKIKVLEKKQKEEQAAKRKEQVSKLSEEKKAKAKKYEERLEKLEEQLAKIEKEQEAKAAENNNNIGNSGNSNGYVNNGRTLVVQNGNFYLPNVRATSDEHTPKGTGEYGLNIEFWNMLSPLINEAKTKGYSITITDGWRPYSRQKQTWLTSVHKCDTNWVACPGGSGHGFGIAADLAYNGDGCSQSNWDCNSAAKWVHDNAARYGLTFRLSNEPWHIEPTNRFGANFGACEAPCS